MGFVELLSKHKRPGLALPSSDEKWKSKSVSRFRPKFSLLQHRIRIRKVSIPIGVLLIFPLTAIILIMIMIFRKSGDARNDIIPAGQPPAIKMISSKYDSVFQVGCADSIEAAKKPRANGAFVVLARNKELDGVIQSIRSIERHFNRWFHYPYVFLNDGDFNSTFKETVLNYTSAPVEFGKLNASHWGYPDWVDKDVAQEGIRKQGDQAIMYGEMESYHHMCRFYSGFFYKHHLLDQYKWYWRLEPEIKYFCDITYDPFVMMEEQKKTYGFTIAIKELRETVPNIFRYASAFKRNNNITSKGLWEMFVDRDHDKARKEKQAKEEAKRKNSKPLPEEILNTEPGKGNLEPIDSDAMEGESYNMCHFWSNFEIASLDWFRSKEYNDFFNTMDRSGGFWMERWGDAPIHSLAAGALLGPEDVHYFRDFGYRHTTIQHCPANAPTRQGKREPYLEMTIADEKKRLEEDEYWARFDREKENGVGCRCRCDTDIPEVEGKEGSCLAQWVDIVGGWVTP